MKKHKLRYIFLFCLLFLVIFSFKNIYANTNLNLVCKTHVAINADGNTVLFDDNANERVYPASTTKILTAIIVLEKLKLDDEITITPQMMAQVPYDSSVMSIFANETYTVKDLLYGLLLVSGNDVAIVFADTISGNMNDFSVLMNEKVKEIGCKNTNFVNAHGYHDDNHYTTAYDMALIFNYCIKNDTFKEIISTKEIRVSPTNNLSRILVLENSNQMFYEDSPVYCKEIQGGKTGFTYDALGTFIGYAIKDNMTIIIGSFGGMADENGNSSRFSDTLKISNYIFNTFEKKTFAKKGDFSFSYTDLTNKKVYTIGLAKDMEYVVPKKQIIEYTVDLNNTEKISTQNIGKILISFPYKNISYTENLEIINSADYHEDISLIIYLALLIVILLLIAKLKQILVSKKRKHNKKAPKI